MVASDGDALSKVLEHLKNVKLESEERLFAMKAQLQARASQVEEAQKRQAQLEDELDFQQSQLEELRRQQSRKHRLEALDDWKALVQQLQADRKRLGDEVDELRSERRLLIAELKKHLGETTKNRETESSSIDVDDRQLVKALAVNGGGAIAGEADALLLLEGQEAGDLRRLRKHCEMLELQNRRSQLEIQRLREQVRRDDGLLKAWGRAAGTLGNYFGLFGGSGMRTVKKVNHPVIQV